jgi:hypothetical protein
MARRTDLRATEHQARMRTVTIQRTSPEIIPLEIIPPGIILPAMATRQVLNRKH